MGNRYSSVNIPRRLPYRFFDKIAIFLSILIFLAVGISLVLAYPHLPERIPVHYGFNGEVDGWGGKHSVWFLYGTHAIVLLLILIMNHFPMLYNRPQWLSDRYAVPFCYLTRRFVNVILLSISMLFGLLQIHPGTPIDSKMLIGTMILFSLSMVVAILWYYKLLLKLKRS